MKNVAVLDTLKTPQNPVHPAVARRMLKGGRAAVYRKHPFTIIRKAPPPAVNSQLSLLSPPAPETPVAPSPLRLKIDHGNKSTGVAIIDDSTGEIIFAAEIHHRGQEIKKSLGKRSARRRARRNRKTRYRAARFLNRRRGAGCHACGKNPAKDKSLCRPCAGLSRKLLEQGKELVRANAATLAESKWLPPSVMHPLHNIKTWARCLVAVFHVTAISVEDAKFDQQLMRNPEVRGVLYQQGTLQGYEVRQYLLEKFQHRCAYCKKGGQRLQIEHVIPRSRAGRTGWTI